MISIYCSYFCAGYGFLDEELVHSGFVPYNTMEANVTGNCKSQQEIVRCLVLQ